MMAISTMVMSATPGRPNAAFAPRVISDRLNSQPRAASRGVRPIGVTLSRWLSAVKFRCRRPEVRGSLRPAESEYHLICPSANQGIKNGSPVIIAGISKRIDLRFEYESCRFNLTFHSLGIDTMQGFSIAQSGAGFGHMVDDQQHSARLQCIEKRGIERGDISRS